MLPVINVFGVAVQVPGLILLLALWLGLNLAERRIAQRQVAAGITSDQLYNLVFIAILAGFIGARLTYAVRYPEIFLEAPLSLFALTIDLFDPLAGAAAAGLAVLAYGQRKGLQLWPTLDAHTPLLAVLALGLALSQAASGEAYGLPAQLPWALQLWGTSRHPTQLYAAAAASLILVKFWNGKRYFSAPPGTYFLAFAAWSAAARLLVEAFRGDSQLLPGGFRLAQIIAWLVLALCLWGLRRLSFASLPETTSTHQPPEDAPAGPLPPTTST